VGVAWGYSNVSGVERAEMPEVEASFGCLRANRVVGGSRPLSAGAVTLGPSSVSLVVGLVMGVIMLLLG
jgi:hypothetical protein